MCLWKAGSPGDLSLLTEGGDQSYELEGGESLGALRYRRLPSWGAPLRPAKSQAKMINRSLSSRSIGHWLQMQRRLQALWPRHIN